MVLREAHAGGVASHFAFNFRGSKASFLDNSSIKILECDGLS